MNTADRVRSVEARWDDVLGEHWWTFVVRGIVAIVFGVLAIVLPGVTLLALILLFGAYAIVDGIFAIVAGIRQREGQRDWLLMAAGIAGVVAGVIAFVWPGVTALALLYLIAAWAIVRGVLEIAAAIRLRQRIENEWTMAIEGIVSILFGIVLVAFPSSGALALILVIGAFAIASGVVLLVFAFRLRRHHQQRTTAPA